MSITKSIPSTPPPTTSDDELSELEWLLKVDVKTSIKHLSQILADCATNIVGSTPTQYNLFFHGQNQMDTIKVNTTIEGYRITNADINIKLSSKHPMQIIKTCIKESASNPFCWRLYQIQDANNHLNNAIDLLKISLPSLLDPDNEAASSAEAGFESAEEVLQLINDIMNSLLKSRSSLLTPKKSSVEELQHCQNMQSISPALPLDYTISFYVQANNLVCSVYQLSQSNNRAQVKNEYQAEVSIPFLSDVLILLGLALQVCQQMLDKIQTLQNNL
uniref:Protein rogdi n=1 Tax=Aceria tosichella TaxID=561515 RepID=A0A6G1SG67_9ACAR